MCPSQRTLIFSLIGALTICNLKFGFVVNLEVENLVLGFQRMTCIVPDFN